MISSIAFAKLVDLDAVGRDNDILYVPWLGHVNFCVRIPLIYLRVARSFVLVFFDGQVTLFHPLFLEAEEGV